MAASACVAVLAVASLATCPSTAAQPSSGLQDAGGRLLSGRSRLDWYSPRNKSQETDEGNFSKDSLSDLRTARMFDDSEKPTKAYRYLENMTAAPRPQTSAVQPGRSPYNVSAMDIGGVRLWMTPKQAEAALRAKFAAGAAIQLKYQPSQLNPSRDYVSEIDAENGDYVISVSFIEIAPGDAPYPVEADEVLLSFDKQKSVTAADVQKFRYSVLAKYGNPTSSNNQIASWCMPLDPLCGEDSGFDADPNPRLIARFFYDVSDLENWVCLDLYDSDSPLNASVSTYLDKQTSIQEKPPL